MCFQNFQLWVLYNPNFKPLEFEGVRKQAGLNSFVLTPKRWIEATNAIGIVSKAGRYGGTFAHKDIAIEFASWISIEWRDTHPNKEGNIRDEARSFTSRPFARTQQNRYYPNENFNSTPSKAYSLENKTPRVTACSAGNTGSFIVLLANQLINRNINPCF